MASNNTQTNINVVLINTHKTTKNESFKINERCETCLHHSMVSRHSWSWSSVEPSTLATNSISVRTILAVFAFGILAKKGLRKCACVCLGTCKCGVCVWVRVKNGCELIVWSNWSKPSASQRNRTWCWSLASECHWRACCLQRAPLACRWPAPWAY